MHTLGSSNALLASGFSSTQAITRPRPASLHALEGEQPDPLGLFEPAFLEAYRTWAFPLAVHFEGSDLHFSVYQPEKWATLNGLCLFQRVCAGTIADSDASLSSFSGSESSSSPNVGAPAYQAASMKLATSYKNFFLPPHLREHPFFSLARKQDWMSGEAFAAYILDKSTRPATAAPTVITVQGVPRAIRGSQRCAHGLSDPQFVIDIGDDDDGDVEDAMDLDLTTDFRDPPGKRKRHSASV